MFFQVLVHVWPKVAFCDSFFAFIYTIMSHHEVTMTMCGCHQFVSETVHKSSIFLDPQDVVPHRGFFGQFFHHLIQMGIGKLYVHFTTLMSLHCVSLPCRFSQSLSRIEIAQVCWNALDKKSAGISDPFLNLISK